MNIIDNWTRYTVYGHVIDLSLHLYLKSINGIFFVIYHIFESFNVYQKQVKTLTKKNQQKKDTFTP